MSSAPSLFLFFLLLLFLLVLTPRLHNWAMGSAERAVLSSRVSSTALCPGEGSVPPSLPPTCWTCWLWELPRPPKHPHHPWCATSLGTVAVTCTVCPWELGTTHAWVPWGEFFPSAGTSSSGFQGKNPFAEIDFCHLCSSTANKPRLGQANDSYSGSIPLPRVRCAPWHMDSEGLHEVYTKFVL